MRKNVLMACLLTSIVGCSRPTALEMLQSDDTKVRNRAVYLLRDLPELDQREEIGRLLIESTRFEVRLHCAYLFNIRREAKALTFLIRALKDKHWLVRQAAVSALVAIGDVSAADPMLDMLGDEEIQSDAAKAFQTFKHTKSVMPLVALLRYDRPSIANAHIDDMNVEVAKALGHQGDKAAASALGKLLDYPLERVSRAAAKSLGKLVGEDFTELVPRGNRNTGKRRSGSPTKARAWLRQQAGQVPKN